jgi:hypothetical protein
MTPRRQRLIDDARDAGFAVTIGDDSSPTTILRTSKRGRTTKGLMIYPDGTAFDATVRLDVARGLRSYADMRAVLGLKSE